MFQNLFTGAAEDSAYVVQIDDSAVSNEKSKHADELNSDISIIANSDENKIDNEVIENVANGNSERLLNPKASIDELKVSKNADVAVHYNDSEYQVKAENPVETLQAREALDLPLNQSTYPPEVEEKSDGVVNEKLDSPDGAKVPNKNRKVSFFE